MDLIDIAKEFDRIIIAYANDDSVTPLMRETIRDISLWSHDSVQEILELPDDRQPEAIAQWRESMRGQLEALGMDPDVLNTMNVD
jgi:hypothetical protein